MDRGHGHSNFTYRLRIITQWVTSRLYFEVRDIFAQSKGSARRTTERRKCWYEYCTSHTIPPQNALYRLLVYDIGFQSKTLKSSFFLTPTTQQEVERRNANRNIFRNSQKESYILTPVQSRVGAIVTNCFHIFGKLRFHSIIQIVKINLSVILHPNES